MKGGIAKFLAALEEILKSRKLGMPVELAYPAPSV